MQTAAESLGLVSQLDKMVETKIKCLACQATTYSPTRDSLIKNQPNSHVEERNAKQEIYKFLRHYRATLHTTTGKDAAELLFNLNYTVRLPELQVPVHDPETRQ